MRSRATHAVHIDTTIGIQQTREFVKATSSAYGLPLIVQKPPHSYEELVTGQVLAAKGRHVGESVWKGFPGPAGHGMMYTRLKERALRRVRSRFIQSPRQERVVFLAGIRVFESARRFRTANEIDREGSVVWVSPIGHWTDRHMLEYR